MWCEEAESQGSTEESQEMRGKGCKDTEVQASRAFRFERLDGGKRRWGGQSRSIPERSSSLWKGDLG